jgi:phosphate transport system substrate-binding protein
MKSMFANKKSKHDAAVSPVVATLVLIVVAVVGAVAVGTIMGAFSSDVGKKTNSGDASGASSTEILVGGSTTVQPASEALAKVYMDEHPGVKITVQGGGSDAGIAGALMKSVDIGAASKAVPSDPKYADLITHQIGGSAVLVITNGIASNATITRADLTAAYNDLDSAGKTNGVHGAIPQGTQLYQRAEGSGTEETIAEWMGFSAKNLDNMTAAGVSGNSGMITAIKGASGNALGFADYGYAVVDGKSVVNIASLSYSTTLGAGMIAPTAIGGSADDLKTEILNSLKGTAKFPLDTASGKKELTRPLNYITNGQPSSVVNSYINFARSPAAKDIMNKEAGVFSVVDFS